MEIERKFLITEFPELPELLKADVEQGYLCVKPVVRIRKKTTKGVSDYKLCFKGKGTLVREEIELDIEENIYERLCGLLEMAPVRKDFRVYLLPDGHRLECSLVDPGEEGEFMYAEVEFDSVDEASSFIPPDFLEKEVTDIPGMSMSSYWEKKRARLFCSQESSPKMAKNKRK